MKYTLIDKQNRATLCEGRSKGFGGGFAKVIDDKVEMVMPLTACGDFYHEVIHTELTDKVWSIYGFNYKKTNLFKDKLAHLVCGILPINHGDKHTEYDKEHKLLESNYKNIQTFLNWFEEQFKVKTPTKISKLGDNRFLFSFDLFWTQGTYKISLYKLLSRNALAYDGKQNPMEFLNQMKTEDVYIWNGCKNKIADMVAGFIPEQKLTDKDSCPHNLGILQFPWPKK